MFVHHLFFYLESFFKVLFKCHHIQEAFLELLGELITLPNSWLFPCASLENVFYSVLSDNDLCMYPFHPTSMQPTTFIPSHQPVSAKRAEKTAHSSLNNSISSINIWWMSKWRDECMSGRLLKWRFLSLLQIGSIREQDFKKLEFQCGWCSWDVRLEVWDAAMERQDCVGPKKVSGPQTSATFFLNWKEN